MIDRKKEIIEIATELFSKNGYDNTSTRELAKAVGISISSIYYFFQSKEEILFSILDLSLNRCLEALRSAINKQESPYKNIAHIIDCMVKLTVVVNKREIGLLLKESRRLSAEQSKIIKNKERDVFIFIRNEISRLNNEGCITDFNPSFLTFALLGIINYGYYWFDPKIKLSTGEFAAQATELFFNGVLKDAKKSLPWK